MSTPAFLIQSVHVQTLVLDITLPGRSVREREGGRERKRGGAREREKEREKEGGSERKRDREREFLFLAGMTGASAPSSYLVTL